MGVIFMRLGIAKIHQEPLPEELSDVSIKACNDLRTDALIRTDHLPVLFGVELGRELRGIDQVTEQHRELAAFGLGRGRDTG